MSRIDVLRDDVSLDEPTLVEGLPGVGLVGKIATDHLAETFEMVHYANVHCEGLPPVATYESGERGLTTPVRLYADAERDLLALRSDVPVSPPAALEFAECLSEWATDVDVTPIYLSGIGREREEGATPALYGVGIGGASEDLDAVAVDPPEESGLVSGPTGALLSHAVQNDRTATCLIVEASQRFPDPQAAARLLEDGVGPLLDAEIPVEKLTESAEEIRQAKRRLAQQMQQAEESTQARPLGMYQ